MHLRPVGQELGAIEFELSDGLAYSALQYREGYRSEILLFYGEVQQ
jgi:hypothetical protein